MLSAKPGHSRIAAIESLGEIGDREVLPTLSLLLQDSDNFVREAALKSLLSINDIHATFKSLIDCLQNSDNEVRLFAVKRFQYFTEYNTFFIRLKKESIPDEIKQIGMDLVISAFIECLSDDQAEVRAEAAKLLGEIKSEEAVLYLKVLLNDVERLGSLWLKKRVCDVASDSLKKINTPEAQVALNKWKDNKKKPFNTFSLSTLYEMLGKQPENIKQDSISTSEKIVINCPICSQKLRVPNSSKNLDIKCPKCTHEWLWKPMHSPSTFPGSLLEVRNEKLNQLKSQIEELSRMKSQRKIEHINQLQELKQTRLELNNQEDTLISAIGVDYSSLRNHLQQKKWGLADVVMDVVLLEALGKKKWSEVSREDILQFPTEDLHTIDSLWSKYSEGNLGISVQKKIYLECGGSLDGEFPNIEVLRKFCSRVGWPTRRVIFFGIGLALDGNKKGQFLGEFKHLDYIPKGMYPTGGMLKRIDVLSNTTYVGTRHWLSIFSHPNLWT
jgi:hypothetical protein